MKKKSEKIFQLHIEYELELTLFIATEIEMLRCNFFSNVKVEFVVVYFEMLIIFSIVRPQLFCMFIKFYFDFVIFKIYLNLLDAWKY